jgi:hypothetical protein
VGAIPWRFKSSHSHISLLSGWLAQFPPKADQPMAGVRVYIILQKGRLAQLVRASRLHREGRRFESYIVHSFLML